MKIVVMLDGAPKGPFDLDGLKEAIRLGHLLPSDLAWHEGQDKWTELHNMPELQSALPTKRGDAQARGPGAAQVNQSSAGTEADGSDAASVQWYFLIGDETCGPSTAEQIRNCLSSGAIPNDTYVFHEGMKDWAKADSMEEFQRCLMSTPNPGEPPASHTEHVSKSKVQPEQRDIDILGLIHSVALGCSKRGISTWTWLRRQFGEFVTGLPAHQQPSISKDTAPPVIRMHPNSKKLVAAIILWLALAVIVIPWLYSVAVNAYHAKVSAALEARQASDPVMKAATRSAWSAIQAAEARLARDDDTSEEGFRQRAYLYSQINTDNADPQLITNVAIEVTVAKEMATVIGNIHTASHESEESREGVKKAWSIFGALLSTALNGMADRNNRVSAEESVNGGAAIGGVVGDIFNGLGSATLDAEVRKTYGPELERCAGNVKILHERREWLANYLSQKYKAHFLNAF